MITIGAAFPASAAGAWEPAGSVTGAGAIGERRRRMVTGVGGCGGWAREHVLSQHAP
jgi:hypothetical protein